MPKSDNNNFSVVYWNVLKPFQIAVKMLNSTFIKYTISIKKEKENYATGVFLYRSPIFKLLLF